MKNSDSKMVNESGKQKKHFTIILLLCCYFFVTQLVTLLPEQFFVDKSLVFRIVGTYFLIVFLSFFIIFVCFIVRQGSTIHCNIDITHLIQRKIKCYIEVLYEA